VVEHHLRIGRIGEALSGKRATKIRQADLPDGIAPLVLLAALGARIPEVPDHHVVRRDDFMAGLAIVSTHTLEKIAYIGEYHGISSGHSTP
jgi:hypothetical protein